MKKIIYQGVKGAFSYITAEKEFGSYNEFIGVNSFREMFDHIHCGKADYAVIALENSLIGSIYENYDLFNQFDGQIIGERYTKIEHCLLAYPGSNNNTEAQLKGIKKVMSHPKALEQCAKFFKNHPWIEAVVHMDTAAAAAEVANQKNPAYAAIASVYAGEIYGLELLRKGIEDNPQNYTRFVIAAKQPMQNPQADKCSLVFTLNHQPGSLTKVLNCFAAQGLNLTKIESRPILGSPFEYTFYVDFEFKGKNGTGVKEIMNELKNEVQTMKLLGFYKAGNLWTP